MAQEFDVERWWKQTRNLLIVMMLNPVILVVIALILRNSVPALRQGGLAPDGPMIVLYVACGLVALLALLSVLRRKRSIAYFLSKPLELEQVLVLYRSLMIRNMVLSHGVAIGGFVFFLLFGNLSVFLGGVVLSLVFSFFHFPRKNDLGMEIL